MKLTEEEIKEFIEVLQQVEQFRPLVKLALDSVKSFGPEIKDVLESAALGLADINSTVFNKYLSDGFSREEALLLIVNQNHAINKLLDKCSVKK